MIATVSIRHWLERRRFVLVPERCQQLLEIRRCELYRSGVNTLRFDVCDHVLHVALKVKRARLQALEYKRQYGSPMPSRLLVLAMADAAQVCNARRVLGTTEPEVLRD